MSTTDTPREYIAAMWGYWGRGSTPVEAFRKLTEANHGRRPKKSAVVTFLLPAGATNGHIDQLGSLRWDWADGADTTGTVKQVETVTR